MVMAKKNKRGHTRDSTLLAIIGLLIVFLILSAVFLVPIMDFFHGSFTTGRVYPERADFTIERRVTLRNTAVESDIMNNTLDYNLTIAQPYNITESDIQYVDSIDWDPEPNFYRKYGSEWKAWDRQIEPSGSDEIMMSYDVRTSTVSWDYSSENSGTTDDISDELKEKYNKNQWRLDQDRNGDGDRDWMIEPDHPEIENLAEEIVQDEENIYDKSRAIYDWIDDNIEYEIGRRGRLPKHAYWVLESGTGDCDEQSFLYASLSRAVGIPAWIELGVLYDRGGERWGGHGWIRTKIISENNTGGWVNIDTVNDQFYFRDALRFTTWVDDGEEDHIEEFYKYIKWGGGELEPVEDDFDDVRMETDGRIVVRNGFALPGFEAWIVIPSVISSIFIYSVYDKKKR